MQRGINLNEIALSNNLEQIEFEINYHKENAGKSIWEIGRRLIHVKENDLAHGEFIKWLEKMSISHSSAKKMMKVVRELPNGSTSNHLGLDALYLITTLPDKQKEETLQRIEDGDSPTVRELRELKSKLKEKDAIIARQAETIDLKNHTIAEKDDIIYRQGEQKTQVIEKEVIPSDYEQIKKENERLHETEKQLTKQLEKVSSDLELAETKYHLEKESSEKAKALKQEIERLSKQEKTLNDKIQAFYEFNDLEDEFNKFFDTKMAPLRFKNLANYMVNTNAVDRMWAMINQAEHWAEEMKKVVPNKNMKIVEGVIIND